MTAQVHEMLILNGEETSMAFCPPLPEDHPEIVALKDDEIQDTGGIIFSTACWREYIGTWEIVDDKFYLKKLEGRYRLKSDSPILADWFTGILRIPQGNMLHYVHMGYDSVFERVLHIKIENGRVTNSRMVDNRNKDFSEPDLG